jgi:hypothetical protein
MSDPDGGLLTPDPVRVKVRNTKTHRQAQGPEAKRAPQMTEGEVGPLDGPEIAASSALLLLSDVYLLTAESDGKIAVPGLTLMLDASGLTVRKPDGSIGAVVSWAEVSGLAASRRIRTPAGSSGVIVEAVTSSRTHRFVVPSANPDGLEYQIGQVAEAMVSEAAQPPSGQRRRSRVLVGALVVVIVAGIALAVLVTTGTVKF